MSEPYVGELKFVGYGFAPKGWALCNGQTLSIAQNSALFALLGTTYGGNGQTTFNLPNLQGRVPFHFSDAIGFPRGQQGGEEHHTLITQELPNHSHTVSWPASSHEQTTNRPDNAYFTTGGAYVAGVARDSTLPVGNGQAGGNAAHPNMQPYLVVNVIIALVGLYPS